MNTTKEREILHKHILGVISRIKTPETMEKWLQKVPYPISDDEYVATGLCLECEWFRRAGQDEIQELIADKQQDIDNYYVDHYDDIEHDMDD